MFRFQPGALGNVQKRGPVGDLLMVNNYPRIVSELRVKFAMITWIQFLVLSDALRP